MASAVLHHVGYVDSLSVTISICLTYTLLIFGIRLYIRNSSYGIDDACVCIATLVLLAHFGTSYACLTDGLGKPYHAALANMNSVVLAGVVTFVLALYLAKLTTLVFMMRISSVMRNKALYYAFIAITVALFLASILLVTVDCPSASGYYWDFAGNYASCPSQNTRWRVMMILDIVSEVVLLFLPIHLVWSLQMSWEKKLIVVGTFWTRTPVIGLSVARQIYVQRLLHAQSDQSLASTMVVVLMEIEATFALASCTIATAKNFTDNFSTSWGMGQLRGAAESYNVSTVKSGSGRGTTVNGSTDLEMKSLTMTTKELSRSMDKAANTVSMHSVLGEGPSRGHGFVLRPEENLFRSKAYIDSSMRRLSEDGSTGGESDELHILRQTEYTVSHDEAPILPKPRYRS